MKAMDTLAQQKVAERFEEMFQQGHKPWRDHPIEPLFYEFLKTLKKSNRNSKVLDIGCGDGWAAILAAKEHFETWGIDTSAAGIDEAIREAAKESLPVKVHFEIGNALNLPYEDHFFDAVIDGGLFHHIIPENRELYFQNILRVMKPASYLYLSAFSDKSQNDVGYHFSKNDIEHLFGKHFTEILSEEDESGENTPFVTWHFIFKRI